jgi:hypothetical protein
MNDIKQLVHELLKTKNNQVELLQRISEELIRNTMLSVGGFMFIQPREVEAYYVNRNMPGAYVDMNMHCVLDPKTNDEIWAMQSDRFGQLYVHRKGLGGVDICLSDSPDYALCFSIKAAIVDGEDVWSALKIRNMLLDAVCKHDGVDDRMKAMDKVNARHSYEVLTLHDNQVQDVYHIRRNGLRRQDKHTALPLRTFTDLWNKKLDIDRVHKVYLFMNAHPDANILDVLRDNEFRYIPLEIKVRYKLDRKAKLYE